MNYFFEESFFDHIRMNQKLEFLELISKKGFLMNDTLEDKIRNLLFFTWPPKTVVIIFFIFFPDIFFRIIQFTSRYIEIVSGMIGVKIFCIPVIILRGRELFADNRIKILQGIGTWISFCISCFCFRFQISWDRFFLILFVYILI